MSKLTIAEMKELQKIKCNQDCGGDFGEDDALDSLEEKGLIKVKIFRDYEEIVLTEAGVQAAETVEEDLMEAYIESDGRYHDETVPFINKRKFR